MRFTVPKSTLAPCLATVAKVMSAKPMIPILSNVCIRAENGQLTVTTSDLTTWVTASCLASVEEPGEIAVNYQIFEALVRSFDDADIECSIVMADPIPVLTQMPAPPDGDQPEEPQTPTPEPAPASAPTVPALGTIEIFRIQAGNNTTHLMFADATQFPDLPAFTGTVDFDITGAALATAVSQVADAATQSGDRPILTGINFSAKAGESVMTATAADSYRLARQEVDIISPPVEDMQFTVSADVVNTIARSAGRNNSVVNVAMSNTERTMVRLESAHGSVTTTPIAGEYPDTEKIIPTEFLTKVYITKGELTWATDCANAVVSTHSAEVPIRLILNPSDQEDLHTMRVWGYTNNEEEFDTLLAVKLDPPQECKIALRPKFLQHALKSIQPNQEVELALNGHKHPAVIRPKGDTRYTYVVMPTYTNWD